jgi:hypothetical protein
LLIFAHVIILLCDQNTNNIIYCCAKNLYYSDSGIPLNAILPIIGVQNKARFSFEEADLGKTG